MMPLPVVLLPDLVRAIEAQYDIQITTPPRALPAGVHSRAWLATSTNGAWIVKLSYPIDDPLATLDQQAHLYAYLNQNGLHTPRFLRLSDGSFIGTFTIDQIDYPIQLMFAQALHQIQPETAQPAVLSLVGELAAQLHHALDQYPGRDAIIANRHKSSNEWGAQLEGVWESILDLPSLSMLSKAERDWLRSVDQRAMEYVQQHYPDLPMLSMAVLHGDLNLEHVQFLDDGAPYIFDFGDMCWGPTAHELAVFFQTIFRDSKLSIPEWEAFQRHVLAGYTNRRTLTDHDQASISPFIVNRIIGQARYIVELATEAQTMINWKIIQRTYGLAEYLT